MDLKTSICDKVNVSNDQEMVQSDRKSHSIKRVETIRYRYRENISYVELAAMLLLVATHPYLTKYTKHTVAKSTETQNNKNTTEVPLWNGPVTI